MWKNVEQGRPQMTIWRMYMACWKTKATDTCSLYVILTAFPLQQQLHQCASELHYMYTDCQILDFCPFMFIKQYYYTETNIIYTTDTSQQLTNLKPKPFTTVDLQCINQQN